MLPGCCCGCYHVFFEIIIIVLLFPVVFFMQVHLYAYTHFYFEPAVRKKMTGTGDSKAHP